MAKLETDGYEYAYLKAIVLFSPGKHLIQAFYLKKSRDQGIVFHGMRTERQPLLPVQDHPGLNSSSQIEKFQEKAQMELQDYVQKTYPDDTYRLQTLFF